MTTEILSPVLGLAAALGGGLLIGLERERRKGRGPHREAAGIRSFALAACAGGMAQALQQPGLVLLGAALVAALVAVAYWKSLQGRTDGTETDPGLTTELALFITYLVGVLCVQQPALGAGSAAVVAGLLAAREKLHRLATDLMSQTELHDALLLAALVLVLLPLTPATPVPLLGGLAPRTLMLTALLILGLQAGGYVALRALGERAGLALSGLMSGFASSTATIAAMGARARAARSLVTPGLLNQPDARSEWTACVAGALFSTVATWIQMLLLVAALAPGALPVLLPAAAAGALVAAGTAGWQWRAAQGPREAAAAGAVAAVSAAPADAEERRPLRLREALMVTALLAVVSAAVSLAQQHFGSAGVLTGVAIAALADAHSPVASLAGLHAIGQIQDADLLHGALIAAAANSLTRTVTGFVAGGAAFGSRVAVSLVLSTSAAMTVGFVWSGF